MPNFIRGVMLFLVSVFLGWFLFGWLVSLRSTGVPDPALPLLCIAIVFILLCGLAPWRDEP